METKWKEIAKKYSAREITRKQLADKLAQPLNQITARLKEQGVEIWDNHNLLKAKDTAEMIDMFKRGKSIQEIATIFNVTYTLVYSRIKGKRSNKEEKLSGNFDYPGKYHEPRLDRCSYALMFYNYNNMVEKTS